MSTVRRLFALVLAALVLVGAPARAPLPLDATFQVASALAQPHGARPSSGPLKVGAGVQGSAPSTWSPRNDANGLFWFRAASQGVADAAAISTATNANGGATTLAGTAVTYDAQTTLRGRGCAKFLSASDSILQVGSGGITGSHAHTIVAITRADATPSTYASFAFFGQQYPSGGSYVGLEGSTNGTTSYWFGRDGVGTPSGGPVEDTQPHVVVKRFSSGTIDGWVDGIHVVRASTDNSYSVSAGLAIGTWASTFGVDSRVWDAVFTNAAITLSQLGQYERWAFREAGIFSLIVDGDSIAEGLKGGAHGDFRSLLCGWPTQQSGASYFVSCGASYNFGVEGQDSTQILAAETTNVTPLGPGSDTSWVRSAGIPQVIVYSGGTNNLANADSGNHATARATAIADTQAYCAAAHLVGQRVIVLGILSDPGNVQPAFFEADRAIINAAYANTTTMGCDAYVDPANAGVIPRDGVDGFHPTDYSGIAALLFVAIRTLIGI